VEIGFLEREEFYVRRNQTGRDILSALRNRGRLVMACQATPPSTAMLLRLVFLKKCPIPPPRVVCSLIPCTELCKEAPSPS
jgi:hypothetical protein